MTPLRILGGLNLRQEDIPGYLAACATASITPGSLPILYTLHDDSEAVAAASLKAAQDAGLWVAIIRFFSPDRRFFGTDVVPTSAHLLGWNETDSDPTNQNLPGWVDGWQRAWRAQRPDVTIHYGAPNVNGYWIPNTALEAALDYVDRHIGSVNFTPPAPFIEGRPTCVSEIDMDPSLWGVNPLDTSYPWADEGTMESAYQTVMQTIAACLDAGIPAFAWGIKTYIADAAYSKFMLQSLTLLNKQYGQPQETNMATPSSTPPDEVAKLLATNAELLAQNALLTELIKCIRTGQWTGAGSVDGIYCALKGGIAAPDYTPSFP